MITSGGNRNPLKPDCGDGARRGWRRIGTVCSTSPSTDATDPSLDDAAKPRKHALTALGERSGQRWPIRGVEPEYGPRMSTTLSVASVARVSDCWAGGRRRFIDDRDPGIIEVAPVYRGGRTVRFERVPGAGVEPVSAP